MSKPSLEIISDLNKAIERALKSDDTSAKKIVEQVNTTMKELAGIDSEKLSVHNVTAIILALNPEAGRFFNNPGKPSQDYNPGNQ